jgi:hypothetical protein
MVLAIVIGVAAGLVGLIGYMMYLTPNPNDRLE